jgi:phosphate transport system substrate-binding protein
MPGTEAGALFRLTSHIPHPRCHIQYHICSFFLISNFFQVFFKIDHRNPVECQLEAGGEQVKKILIIALIMAAFSVSGGLTSSAQTQPAERGVITVTGADSMWGRIRSLAVLYMKDHPQLDITVSPNSLADEGMKALIAGEVDVAMTSRKITAQESEAAKVKGLQLDEHLIGYGGIVIVTDKQNPVDELSIEQVKKIFTGQIVNWKDISGKDQAITVFKSGPKNPGTLLFVENNILGGVPITKNAIILQDFPAIIKKVGETAGSIAYVRMRDPFPGPAAKTKNLKIKKDAHSAPVSPSRATIADGTYPLRRPYYLYTAATAGKDVRSFVDFVVSRGWGEPRQTHEW